VINISGNIWSKGYVTLAEHNIYGKYLKGIDIYRLHITKYRLRITTYRLLTRLGISGSELNAPTHVQIEIKLILFPTLYTSYATSWQRWRALLVYRGLLPLVQHLMKLFIRILKP
jgi:hypothetical protein